MKNAEKYQGHGHQGRDGLQESSYGIGAHYLLKKVKTGFGSCFDRGPATKEAEKILVTGPGRR
jgi:hypothetical protein